MAKRRKSRAASAQARGDRNGIEASDRQPPTCEELKKHRVIFSRFCRQLTTVTSPSSLMNAVRQATEKLLGWDYCFLAHRPLENEKLNIVCYMDTVRGRKKHYPGGLMCHPPSTTIRRVLRGQALLINRRSKRDKPRMRPAGSMRFSYSLMFVPIRCCNRVIGVFTVQSYTPNRYGAADLEVLQQVADVIAPTLNRLYAEDALRKAHRELEDRVRQRTAQLKAVNDQLRWETRQRKEALKAMKDSEARFRIVTEHSLSGVYIFGEGRMQYVNSAFARIFGYDRREIVSMDPYRMVHPEDRALAAEHIRRRMSRETDWVQYRFRGLRKDGTIVHCEALGRYTVYRGKPTIIGNMVDITKSVQAEEALRKSEESLRRLSVETDRLLEFERSRIARELHDDLGQMLTALNMNLAWISRQMGNGDEACTVRVTESIGYVGQMTAIVRSMCKSLHPVVLDYHGLAEAVRTLVQEFQHYSRISCKLMVRPVVIELSQAASIAVYRIIQEALTNVARHSKATRCRVSIRQSNKFVSVSVCDDGVGSASDRLLGGYSLGVLGMKERATAVGGTFEIKSVARGGVEVTVRLPR